MVEAPFAQTQWRPVWDKREAQALAVAAGSLSQVLVLAAGLHPEEVAAYAFFGKTTPHGEPQQVPRHASLTPEQFDRFALDGRPFVLEDGGRGQPFVGWSCDRFKEEFPNGVVKVEYVQGSKPVRSMKDDWQNEKHKIPNADPDGPQYAPWYWGVKGANDAKERKTVYGGNRKNNPLPNVQSLMRIPDYMRNTTVNRNEILGSPEFWFSAPQAGAQMHMDAHCESTFAIQLSGKRLWKLGWVPAVPDGLVYQEGTYGDGAVYGKGYHVPLEAELSEGQALFFPSGFLHSTINIGETCAASLTFQFRDPIPARYFRHSMKHLRRTMDFSECWEMMAQVAHSSPMPKGDLPPEFDQDGRGHWKAADATSRLHRASHTFYDVNEDGVVTQKESAEGRTAWHEVLKVAKQNNKKVHPRNFAYLAEADSKEEL